MNVEIYSYNDLLRDVLRDIPCVLAYETAADYLGMSEGCDSMEISVFATVYNEELDGIGRKKSLRIRQIIVPSFDEIDYVDWHGLHCTTPQQTIIDLLEQDGDNQVIQESLATYYFSHGESFDGLKIPEHLNALFEKYSDWAIHYYDEY